MDKSPWHQAFDQGYACAVANIIRTHGDSTIARDVLAANRPHERYVAKEDRAVLREAGLLAKQHPRASTGKGSDDAS